MESVCPTPHHTATEGQITYRSSNVSDITVRWPSTHMNPHLHTYSLISNKHRSIRAVAVSSLDQAPVFLVTTDMLTRHGSSPGAALPVFSLMCWCQDRKHVTTQQHSSSKHQSVEQWQYEDGYFLGWSTV
jgi:hypothetical protein